MLEREEQLASVTALARSACAGSGCAVVVKGSAGIGKTRFLAEVEAQARHLGMLVLSARGCEPEREFAFGVVRQLLEDLVHSAAAEERRELLDGAARTAAPLLGASSEGASRHGARAAQEGFAVVHGLYWLCANLAARTPVVLLVDDAHWADEPSVRWLHFLCGRIEELSVLAVVATRTDEPGMEGPPAFRDPDRPTASTRSTAGAERRGCDHTRAGPPRA
jgi:predicted ATPase